MTIKRCFLFVLMCSYLSISTAQISPEELAKQYQCDEIEPSEPELRLELLDMERVDQEARSALNSSEMTRVDAENTERLSELLDTFDWLGIDLVGCDGANAAWLIAQHADMRLSVQKIALERLKAAVEKDQAMPWQLAYLTDRVRVNSSQEQIYGTQMMETNGELIPQPIEEPERVNDLRLEVGLGTLEEYMQGFQDMVDEQEQ